MKNTVLCAGVLLALFLTSCAATAGPAVLPMDSTPVTQPSIEDPIEATTLPTVEPTENALLGSGIAVTWESSALLSMLPHPTEDLQWALLEAQYPPEEVCVVANEATPEGIKAYIDELKKAGFDLDTQYNEAANYKGEVEQLHYYAHNEKGVYVMANLLQSFTLSGENCWMSRIEVCIFPNGTPPTEAVPASQPWGNDSVRALVPQPPTDYWKSGEDTVQISYWKPSEHTYQIPYCTLDQLKAYTYQLWDYGFDCHTYEYMGMGHYFACGQNQQGVAFKVEWDLTKAPYPVLQICLPGTLDTELWVYSYYNNSYLPEPDRWHVQVTYSEVEIYLYGMDVQDAEDYFQTCVDFAEKNGNNIDAFPNKGDNGTVVEYFLVYKEEHGAKHGRGRWYLVYDPQDEECPCKLIKPYF